MQKFEIKIVFLHEALRSNRLQSVRDISVTKSHTHLSSIIMKYGCIRVMMTAAFDRLRDYLKKIEYKKIFFHLSIFYILVLTAQLHSDEPLNYYNMITGFTDREKQFINEPFTDIDLYDLVDYYIMLSGDMDRGGELHTFFNMKSDLIDAELFDIYKTTDIDKLEKKDIRLFAETIHLLIHKHFLREYVSFSDKFSWIKDSGKYNCVSSSILYAIFLYKYGIKVDGVEVKDHVFVSVVLPDGNVDVETTNRYGFDPGSRKEFHSEFGDQTGFTYVPQKNYSDRNIITMKKLLLLVSHNFATMLSAKYLFVDAAKVSYLVKMGRLDSKGDDDFYKHFSNFLMSLSKNGKYKTALGVMELYFDNNSFSKSYDKLRYDIMSDIVVSSSSLDELASNREYITKNHDKYPSKDYLRFTTIISFLDFRMVDFFNKQSLYDESYSIISRTSDIKTKNDMLNNTFNTISQKAIKTGDYDTAMTDFEKALKYSLGGSVEYIKYKFILINNHTATLLKTGDYKKALLVVESEYDKNTGDRELLKILKNVYINYAYDISKKGGDYRGAIDITLKALGKIKNDPVLLNNLKFYYTMFIGLLVSSGRNEDAAAVKLEALGYFPEELFFKK